MSPTPIAIPKDRNYDSSPERNEERSAQDHVRELLDDMKRKKSLPDTVPEDQTDTLLNALSFRDFPELRCA